MSAATFGAVDMAMLALIGIATPLICYGGIWLAYRSERRASPSKAADAQQAKHGAGR